MKWVVALGDAQLVLNVQSFRDAVDQLWATLGQLPTGFLPSKVGFEGRCFAVAAAPLVTVVNEDSFTAFNEAAAQFLGGPPKLNVVNLAASATPPDQTPSPASIISPSKKAVAATKVDHETLCAAVATSRVQSRLNSIKKTYQDMTVSAASSNSIEAQMHATLSPKKRAVSGSRSPAKASPAHNEDDATAVRMRYQRELEEAELEEQQATKPVDVASSSFTLMIWGTQVSKGVPLNFQLWNPPSLATLKHQAASLLQQPVGRLSYRTEVNPVEVDLEDDTDVATMASLAQKIGIDLVSVIASPPDDTVQQQPMSFVKLRRELKQASTNKSGGGNVTPITSPIKNVYAPSPIPQAVAKAKPSHSVVAQLD